MAVSFSGSREPGKKGRRMVEEARGVLFWVRGFGRVVEDVEIVTKHTNKINETITNKSVQ